MDLRSGDAVETSFDTLSVDFDHFLKVVEDGSLDTFDPTRLVGFMQDYERFRNRLSLIDHQIVKAAQQANLAGELCHSTLPRALAAMLRISSAEAARRVRAAEVLAERNSMLGQPLDPGRPHLAKAQRDGEVSPEQVDIAERALSRVDRAGFDPGDIAWGEQKLAEYATTFGPKDLRRLAEQIVDGINPDGTLPDDQLQADRRDFHLRPTRDGGWAGEFRLTAEAGSKLQAVLGPLAKPKINVTETADGRRVEEPDPRHHGQRMHDALEEVCDRLLRSDQLPDAGGTPATVVVTIDLEDLLNRTGYAVTGDGTLIRTDKALALADQADVYWAAVSRGGVPLRMGRTRRIATAGLTAALIARDRGCSFPGCDTAPEWCERHHVVAWVDGGATDLDNLTLLCRYHHHNFLTNGWECEINSDGLPEWRPPWPVDRERRPLINTRIRAALAARTRRRR